MNPTDRTARLLRILLRLYPRAYRERYGGEIEAFERERRADGDGGRAYRAGLVWDHLRAAVAVRRAGGMNAMKGLRRPSEARARWSPNGVLEDLAGGVRSLRRAPIFTTSAALTLALGIGATTAVFSVVDRVILRPLPYPGSERMVLVGIDPRHDSGSVGPLSGPLALRLQEAPGPAEAVVAASHAGAVLQDGGEPERLEITRVTGGFFPFFGARPAVGRLPREDDYAPGAERVAVLGHAFWRDRYGSDPGAIGRSIRLDDEVHTVVGVLGEGFVPPPEIVEARDVWVPLPLSAEAAERGTFFLAGVARLRPGVSLAEMDAHADRIVEEVYKGGGPNFLLGGSVTSYRDVVLGPVGGRLGRVLAAVALLLGIACVNVASLTLTRGAGRARELAVRSALGAGRGRLARHLLGESALIAAAGGALGGVLAWGAVELFRRHAPAGASGSGALPRLEEVAVDARGLAFALALGAATVLLFGLVPALRGAGAAGGGRSLSTRPATGGRGEGRLRALLVGVETALAVTLAVGSGLLAHDLIRVVREEPGFRPDGLVTARLDLSPHFGREEWGGAWERLLEGADRLPGVAAAAVATQAPYAGTRMASTYRPEGTDGEEVRFVATTMVGGDYVGTLGTRVVEGRGFTPVDDGVRAVALVNEAFVRRYWPDGAAVGKRVRSGGDDEPVYEVVGVLADVLARAGRETPPHVYLPIGEGASADMELMVRTTGDPEPAAAALRELVRRLDPALPLTRVGSVRTLAVEQLARPRFYTALFGGFAALALALALVGVWGTTAYAGRARTREIGIRLALGARRVRVVGGVAARSGVALIAGVVAGLLAAGVTAGALADALRYVGPRDAGTYAAVGLLVLAAGAGAAWLPAARAGRVDPAIALRDDG